VTGWLSEFHLRAMAAVGERCPDRGEAVLALMNSGTWGWHLPNWKRLWWRTLLWLVRNGDYARAETLAWRVCEVVAHEIRLQDLIDAAHAQTMPGHWRLPRERMAVALVRELEALGPIALDTLLTAADNLPSEPPTDD